LYLLADDVSRELNGKIWASLIAPRPIALISTRNNYGVPNIAPYNSYAGLATHPPMLGVSFSRSKEGCEKNTLTNIKNTGVFIINLVPRFLAEIMNKSAEGDNPEDDFARLGVTPASGKTVD
jgi:flavin reductase (DIM6/NTAB) family NADH-FMN oxidoreductase RutF